MHQLITHILDGLKHYFKSDPTALDLIDQLEARLPNVQKADEPGPVNTSPVVPNDEPGPVNT